MLLNCSPGLKYDLMKLPSQTMMRCIKSFIEPTEYEYEYRFTEYEYEFDALVTGKQQATCKVFFGFALETDISFKASTC